MQSSRQLPGGVGGRFILLVTAISLLIIIIAAALNYRPPLSSLTFYYLVGAVLMASFILAVLVTNLSDRLTPHEEDEDPNQP
jgi:hypothetical protein